MLDVTMTACRRPDILNKTLSSFGRLITNQWKDCRLIINVDPVGGPENLNPLILSVCKLHFKDVLINFPDTPNFSRAFKWNWLMCESEYVLNLEDDWEAMRTIDLNSIIKILKDEKDLALIRLPMFSSGQDGQKNWTTVYPWNGRYFECPIEKRDDMGFCGHPSIIKGSYIKSIAPYINETKNPEKQFHSRGRHIMMQEVRKWRYGVWGPQNTPPAIRDIGRKWLINTNWRKKGTKAFFTVWEEISNEA